MIDISNETPEVAAEFGKQYVAESGMRFREEHKARAARYSLCGGSHRTPRRPRDDAELLTIARKVVASRNSYRLTPMGAYTASLSRVGAHLESAMSARDRGWSAKNVAVARGNLVGAIEHLAEALRAVSLIETELNDQPQGD